MTSTNPASRRRRPPLLLLLPLIVFLGLAGVFYVRLFAGDPSVVPSALIGRTVPSFDLPALEGLAGPEGQIPGFGDGALKRGRVTVVNVWASWCVPCRDEHPVLVELAQDDRFELYGINYKDPEANARRFLGHYGNPFVAVGADRSGRVGIDWGVYGVPETFVVDGEGRIVYKHIGPLMPGSVEERLMPAIERALSAGS